MESIDLNWCEFRESEVAAGQGRETFISMEDQASIKAHKPLSQSFSSYGPGAAITVPAKCIQQMIVAGLTPRISEV